MPVLMGQRLAGRSESITPSDKGHISRIGEEIVVGRRVYIVKLTPKDRLLAMGTHRCKYAIKEWDHQLCSFGISRLVHHGSAVGALVPVGRYSSLIASQMQVW
jgi:hypothetical protein